jgi:recombination protein RecT
MRRKTVVRRLVKYLPISVELSRAAALDEAHEVGLPTADVDVTEFQVVEDSKPEPPTIEKALAAPAEKKPEEKAPESTQSQTIAEGNAALAAETLNAKRERTAQALARKGFKGAKVLQFIGATIGTATQVDTLTGPECDRVLEALA